MSAKCEAVSIGGTENREFKSDTPSSRSGSREAVQLSLKDFDTGRSTTVEFDVVGQDNVSQFDDLSKEERLERAKEMMEKTDPIEIDIPIGEIKRLNDTTFVERTEDGFTLYHIN